jgi:orotate phosphoribosyltransferase
MSAAVAGALLDIGAVGFCAAQPIRFKSGLLSPVYCDNRRFPFHPAAWRVVIDSFAERIMSEGIAFDAIAGIEAAGIPHSAALGFALARPSVFVRKQAKEHGTKKLVEGGDVDGRRVLLVEDLVSTGMSSLAGVRALRAGGATVNDCLAIVSYEMPEAEAAFAEAGVRLHTLTEFAEVMATAAQREIVDPQTLGIVLDWFADPHGWERRAGWSA